MKKRAIFLILQLSLLMLFSITSIAQAAAAEDIVKNIQTAFVSIGGSVVAIGWVIAGVLYLTAAGSPEKLGTAKKALFAAVVGTAIIVIGGAGTKAYDFIAHYVTGGGGTSTTSPSGGGTKSN